MEEGLQGCPLENYAIINQFQRPFAFIAMQHDPARNVKVTYAKALLSKAPSYNGRVRDWLPSFAKCTWLCNGELWQKSEPCY